MVLRRRSVAQSVIHPHTRPDITAKNVDSLFRSEGFRNVVSERLAGAVRIPTAIYNEMGRIGKDSRWEIFYQFSEYLEKTFPQIYEKLEVTSVNVHGLLFTWPGSDPTLRPLLFMAHSDVVPAPDVSLDQWTYPPYSGHQDGEFVWGRGSEDDKSNLIGILTAMDALLTLDYKPSRTVILSVGFDEEGGGEISYGARCLAEHLLKKYGQDGIEMIVDEGIAGIESHFGRDFALPATAEKGYIDVRISNDMPGGHSSVPPDHTAIGLLAQAIQVVESNQFPSKIAAQNPTMCYLREAALHAKDMPEDLRSAILDHKSNSKLIEYMNRSPNTRALVRTSTAVDIVRGGDKANILPENAYAIVNHRIAVHDSVQTVKDHYTRIITPLAKKWNFSLHAFDASNHSASFDRTSANNPSPKGTLTLTAYSPLEPSPVSMPEDPRFHWLAGTLRAVFGSNVIVAPVLLTGNTDTQFFWALSSQIYRISPWRASHDPRGTRMHTVDERMPIEGLVEMVRWYHELIRVVDEQRL